MSSRPRANDDLKRIGDRFVQLREEHGYLSQAELSRDSGVDQSSISRIETGKYDYKLTTLMRLLSFLKCEVGDFFIQAGLTRESTDYKHVSFVIEMDVKGLRNIHGHVDGAGIRKRESTDG